MAALEIRKDRTPAMLRKLAKETDDARVARRGCRRHSDDADYCASVEAGVGHGPAHQRSRGHRDKGIRFQAGCAGLDDPWQANQEQEAQPGAAGAAGGEADRRSARTGERQRLAFFSPTGNGPIRRDAATKAVARAQAAIGLAHFHAHDLRRTAVTRMAELQVSPHTISLILNHSSARKGTVTSAVYIQYSYDKEKREGLELWGRLLEGIVATVEQRSTSIEPAEVAPTT